MKKGLRKGRVSERHVCSARVLGWFRGARASRPAENVPNHSESGLTSTPRSAACPSLPPTSPTVRRGLLTPGQAPGPPSCHHPLGRGHAVADEKKDVLRRPGKGRGRQRERQRDRYKFHLQHIIPKSQREVVSPPRSGSTTFHSTLSTLRFQPVYQPT